MAALPGSAGFQPAGSGIFQMPARCFFHAFKNSVKMHPRDRQMSSCFPPVGSLFMFGLSLHE
jgi:hypothetical protein